ncbi:MAG TPA: flagellar motor switch protein FliG [Gaiellaceae bacterium]|jgi:flagellar motor switch protein FliG
MSELVLADPTALAALSGRRKAAMLCVSVGPEAAAEIMKQLPQDMVELLTIEMARTPTVNGPIADAVLQEVVETAHARGYISAGGIAYARSVLEKAIGAERAEDILARLATVIEVTPFEFLRGVPPDHISNFLRQEHPQTVALVIANLPTTDLAARVMQQIPPEQQPDIATRIALMAKTSPDVVREVARVMRHNLESVTHQEYAAAGGVEALATILNSVDRTTERNILERLAVIDSELADQVRALLFVFEDVLKLDDRAIQMVLKEIDSKDLALALRGASSEVGERLMANMSSRAAEMLAEEIEIMPPQRRKVVEEAQSKVVAAVRKLEEAGEIFVSRGAGVLEDDEQVV